MTRVSSEFGTCVCCSHRWEARMRTLTQSRGSTGTQMPSLQYNSSQGKSQSWLSLLQIIRWLCGTSLSRWMKMKTRIKWMRTSTWRFHHKWCSSIRDRIIWRNLDSIHNSQHSCAQLPRTVSICSDLIWTQLGMRTMRTWRWMGQHSQ